MLNIPIPEKIKPIVKQIHQKQGHAYFVGGCVRDALLNRHYDDYDIEVYHLSIDELESILSEYGKVNDIGKPYGILTIQGYPNYEFALPRIDRKIGENHQDFQVEIYPDLSIQEAIKRRDLTINTFMYDLLNKQLIENKEAMEDLKKHRLKPVNPELFIEDPLRLYRLASFYSRLGFHIDEETIQLCKKMNHTISEDRLAKELEKILMSDKPSLGIKFLNDMHALPEYLLNLEKTHQRLDYHPEGNVLNHTLLVLDVAALSKHKVSNPLGFMWGALFHDIGKPFVTTKEGHAKNHDKVGALFFNENVHLIKEKKLRKYVHAIIKYHMLLATYARRQSPAYDYLRFLKDIENQISLDDIYLFTLCDKLGRGKYLNINELKDYVSLMIDKYGKQALNPIITGKDLENLNIEKKRYQEILDNAYTLQLKGKSKEEILRRIKNAR